ncbi:PAS domain-containing hybrid sensor histidine kinase/response regulator [Cellvibrio sp. pealriver]|uniref:PAS domain-containing hybrid sensor histidine kinase/response regulator n=1 Tax=Cellvibrio sp. pealriver TaxID=1622269 RepID=UPI0009E2F236|nr:PAS domain-containing hybrid sensor histidine kinase/response regulator [Cellvibrio sp. pealriver]
MPNFKFRVVQKSRLKRYFSFVSLVNPPLISAVLAIALLFFFTAVALRHIHASQERVIREHLQTSLNSFSELITIWQQQNVAAIQMLANSSQGKNLLRQVLLEKGDNPATHEALREWLYPVLMVMGFDGFSVINHERILVAASSENYHKQKVQLAETHEVLDKALANHPAISRPVAALRPISGPRGTQPAGTLMQNMCVLLEPGVTAPGYFCLRFNTQASFFPIFFKGRTGGSGEIYAIDNHGRLMTPLRFHNDSSHGQPLIGLGEKVRRAANSSDAGPLTDMVGFLINHEAGLVKVGYEDYRGVKVAGAGRWIDEMELGVIVEQDISEAMAPYQASRNIIIGLSVSANLLIILLTITGMVNRRRLAIREGRFRSLLDNLPAATHMTSMDHRLIMVNPAFCSLLMLDEHDLLGVDLHHIAAPNWLKPLLQAEEQVGADSYWKDVVSELKHPDGSPRYYRIVRFPIVHGQDQEPQAITCIWVDVTERIVATQRMEEVNQNLEQMIDERTRELMAAKDAALAASQSKAEFLANMSHEIRTPLNAIIGLAHVALANKPEAKQRTYLEKMRGSGEHLLDIVNDILNFSRMEAGKLSLDHSEFSVVQLIDKTVDQVWEKAAAKGLAVNVNIDEKIPSLLLGDALRLGQILINFCANAVKFTDQGSISINAFKVRDWEDRVEVLFEVQDTGIGIDAEKQAKLFQPFQQVDSSSARRFEGTGLGLSICKNLADLMNARIDVQSAPGHGSSFRLRVQLEKARPQTIAPLIQPNVPDPVSAAISCKILVVEDNLLNQEIIFSLLESMGAEVMCVGSGPEALAALQQQALAQQPFDVVLMDIQLPGMDGVETTARIRELAIGKHLPIIAVTANALPGDKETYLAAGMDDYLSKPIEPAQLRRVLEQWGHACRVAPELVSSAGSMEFLHNAGIDTQRALHNLMGNEKLYRRLLERFAHERAEFPAQLPVLLEKNPAEALNQVHSLKSLAGSLGMNQLEVNCFQLEQALHNGEWQQDMVDKLDDELIAMVELVARGLNLPSH